MTEDALLHDFTRAVRHHDRVAIQVLWITWPHPHEPKSCWHTVVNLPSDANKCSIGAERANLLEHATYFAVCEECHERNPAGWMLDEHICQSCAESKHRVVF